MIKNIRVNLENYNYSIYVGQCILNDLGKIILKNKLSNSCVIITNPTINNLFGKKLKNNLEKSNINTIVIEIPDSETSKSLKVTEKVYVKLIEKKIDRNSFVIALGGGVVGDLAGYIAATYLRGISLIQVPTTLLAQVDSAIGGKVGVDLPQGKNLVGAFYQPKFVLSDITTLNSLSTNELKSGLAEVIKYGIISDPDLFNYINKNIEKIKNKDVKVLENIVINCSKIKAKVVEKDEKEKGHRAILNLGHTLGHALESETKYLKYNHGQAISIGMIYAAKISTKIGYLEKKEFEKIFSLIKLAELPIKINENVEVDRLIETMLIDKKVKDKKIRMVLPKKIGEVFLTDKIPMNLLKNELRKMIS